MWSIIFLFFFRVSVSICQLIEKEKCVHTYMNMKHRSDLEYSIKKKKLIFFFDKQQETIHMTSVHFYTLHSSKNSFDKDKERKIIIIKKNKNNKK